MRSSLPVNIAALLPAILLMSTVVTAADPSPVDRFEARVHDSGAVAGGKLNYRFLIPTGYDAKAPATYPLVLFLHGAGERGTDNAAQLKWGGQQLATDLQKAGKCFVIAPQCPPGKQWVNTPWAKGSYSSDKVAISDELKMAIEVVEKAVGDYKIDKSRLYVMGLSMGGFGTWDAIVRRPDLFAAAVPICGGGDPSKAANLKGIGIWTFHGDADTAVPTAGTREMVAALRKAGVTQQTLKYNEYPGVGHNCWSKAWETKGLWEWMLASKKSSSP
ncbi:carboxylesterase family protein [Humisphaera borealis]|uniref:Prolyl oligopeptidase family serine peptidase n=1 Tax=Humisphaera borealis TaxID=2807512 RepID=A0A7M2X2Z9_9BACT|nr:prolyl oligopeptidase family serine peptidase [Humisphaera borealis]QOV91999.1 prolyl oligopeptidase family serine peptidase [Humisphaera borealis]